MKKNKTAKKNHDRDSIAKELSSIKKLLMLLLVKYGVQGKELSSALNIDQGNLSREFPIRDFNKFDFLDNTLEKSKK